MFALGTAVGISLLLISISGSGVSNAAVTELNTTHFKLPTGRHTSRSNPALNTSPKKLCANPKPPRKSMPIQALVSSSGSRPHLSMTSQASAYPAQKPTA